MSDAAEAVKLTPTQRLERERERAHAETMAMLTRPQRTASDTISVGRDSRGYHYDVNGVRGEAETWDELGQRVLAVCETFNAELDFAPPVTAEIARNAKGDIQWEASGDPSRSKKLADELTEAYPLSRSQHYGRDYLPNEKDTVKKAKP